MYPHERSLVKQLADKPFAIIGVNSDEKIEDARKAVKEKNLNWRSFQNAGTPGSRISDQWRVQGWPTVYILDAEGKIRFKEIRGGEAMDAAITELLAEIGHDVTITHDHESE